MTHVKVFASKDRQARLFFYVAMLPMLGGLVSIVALGGPARVIISIIGINGLLVSVILIRRYGLLFLLAALMISGFLSRYELAVGSYSVRPEHIVGIAAFVGLVSLRLLARRKVLRVDWSTLLVISWVLINGLASYLNAPEPHESYRHVLRMALLAMVYLTVANGLNLFSNKWVASLKLWLGLAVLEAAYGIVAWIAAGIGETSIGVRTTPRLSFPSIYGTLLERDIFGSLAGSIFVMLLFIFLQQWRFKRRILFKNNTLFLGLAITGFALLLSYVRAAWIATFVCSGLAYLWLDNRFRGHLARLSAMGLAVMLIAVLVFVLIVVSPQDLPLVNRLRTFGNLGLDPTWLARVEENRLAIEDWLKHPFIGNGTGSFSQIHGSVRGKPAWIGNLLLHTLVDTGLVGLLVQLLLFGRILCGAMRLSRKAPDLRITTGLLALSWGMLGLLIAYQATDATWFAIFWIHLGLMESGNRFARGAMHEQALPLQSSSVNLSSASSNPSVSAC